MNKQLNFIPIILAGGFGTRLKSVVSDRPKVLALINGKPFITFILSQLANEGFKDVILSTGYMGDMIKKTIGKEYQGLKITYFKENEPLGTGGAIKNIAKSIQKNYLLVINGDTFHNIKRKRLISMVQDNNDVMLCMKKKDASRYGLINVARKNLIISIQEKNNFNKSGLINIGTYLLNKESLLKYRKKIFSLEKDYFPTRIIDKKLYAQIESGKFIDIGIPKDYLKANEYIS